MNRFILVDSGTMDTAIQDTKTGRDYLFQFESSGQHCEQHDIMDCEVERCGEQMYDSFVDWCIDEIPEIVAMEELHEEWEKEGVA